MFFCLISVLVLELLTFDVGILSDRLLVMDHSCNLWKSTTKTYNVAFFIIFFQVCSYMRCWSVTPRSTMTIHSGYMKRYWMAELTGPATSTQSLRTLLRNCWCRTGRKDSEIWRYVYLPGNWQALLFWILCFQVWAHIMLWTPKICFFILLFFSTKKYTHGQNKVCRKVGKY